MNSLPRSALALSLARPFDLRPRRFGLVPPGPGPGQAGAGRVRPIRHPQGRRPPPDRWRPRRGSLGRRAEDPLALRMAARGQRPRARRYRLPRHLRPPQPLHRVPLFRPRAEEDPGPSHGPGRHRHAHHGRPRQLHDRLLQRRAPGLPVPGQSHGRPGRRQLQRARGLRGLLLGRHLEGFRQDHGLGLGRRGGHPARPAPFPQVRRAPDLGPLGRAVLAPRRPSSDDVPRSAPGTSTASSASSTSSPASRGSRPARTSS